MRPLKDGAPPAWNLQQTTGFRKLQKVLISSRKPLDAPGGPRRFQQAPAGPRRPQDVPWLVPWHVPWRVPYRVRWRVSLADEQFFSTGRHGLPLREIPLARPSPNSGSFDPGRLRMIPIPTSKKEASRLEPGLRRHSDSGPPGL